MTTQTLSRRSFIRASVAAGGGLMLGFHMPVALAATHRPADAVDDDRRRHRDQRLDRDRQGRHRHAAHPAHRDGPGRHHLRRDADRRGAQRRLVEDQDRVRRRQPASAQQQRIQGDEHARLAARAPAASASDGRRRLRARAPQAGRRGGVGRRSLRRSRRSLACSRRATAPAPMASSPRPPPRSSSTRSRRSRPIRPSGGCSASRGNGSTSPTRSTAARNTPSIRACPAWSMPP